MAGERILIVEDESIVARDIQLSAGRLGYAVVGTATCGEEALARIAEFKPDLVLMDIKLKGAMDGIAVAELIHERFAIPVVFLTAYADEHSLTRARDSQAFGYLLKPFEERELRMAIELALYRCRMERQLIETQEWLETTLRCLGEAVIATDARGLVRLINPVAEKMTGWPLQEAVGRRLNEIFCLQDAARGADAQSDESSVLETPLPVDSQNAILIARSGRRLPVEYNASSIQGGHPCKKYGTVVVFHDISCRLAALERERELHERLARSRRMESLGVLAGGVADELNKILEPVADYPEKLMRDLPADSPRRADLEMIGNSVRKAVEVVYDLLTLGRIGHVPFEPLQLTELVEDSLHSPELQAARTQSPLIDISVGLKSDMPIFLGSRQHLQTIFKHLLICAFNAMPEGGRLSIVVTSEKLEKVHEGFELIDSGEYAVLRVKDSGAKISAEDISRIFEPFYNKQAAGRRSESGLGLALVYNVVKEHNGFLDVRSLAEHGTEFAIYFPVAAVDAGMEPAPVSTGLGVETILVVEDDQQQRRELAIWLRRHGYRVLTAANGRAALKIFASHAATLPAAIDLAFIDMVLGEEWDGLETYRRMLEINPRQRAIVVSGLGMTSRSQEALRLGAGSFLKKPYTMESAGQAIRQELDKA